MKSLRDAHSTEYLQALAAELIEDVLEWPELYVTEGVVLSCGEAPYRRLDCDGRALAYVRTRPKKGIVRIDITGLWLTPKTSRLRMPNAGGAATLFMRSGADRAEVLRFLTRTVERTRRKRIQSYP